MNHHTKIILGCGGITKEGYEGIDIQDFGQKHIRDIRLTLPYCDNSVDEIIANSVLEHFNEDERIRIFNELWRVLRLEGHIELVVPYAGHDCDTRDITHKSHWTLNTFDYLEGTRPKAGYGFVRKWEVIKKETRNGRVEGDKLIYVKMRPYKHTTENKELAHGIKLELGCGNDKTDGIGLDIKDYGQDIIHDIKYGLPFCDESISVISAKHILEHFTQDELITVLNDCHRVLIKGGKLNIEVPHITSHRAYILPHKIQFTEETIRDLTLDDRYEIYGIKEWNIDGTIVLKDKKIFVTLIPRK